MTSLLDASIICTLLFDDDGATEMATFLNSLSPDPAVSTSALGETVGAMRVRVRPG